MYRVSPCQKRKSASPVRTAVTPQCKRFVPLNAQTNDRDTWPPDSRRPYLVSALLTSGLVLDRCEVRISTEAANFVDFLRPSRRISQCQLTKLLLVNSLLTARPYALPCLVSCTWPFTF